jgi:hypothetical protein
MHSHPVRKPGRPQRPGQKQDDPVDACMRSTKDRNRRKSLALQYFVFLDGAHRLALPERKLMLPILVGVVA